ncbi:hypothetical protein ABZ023_22385 [Streptomyces sp. NPDC006367]|uniref:hypothetical protein n=1 Tax=unclassified Streptomyces TaxID=2593676 RepID=UPI0033AC97FA
MVAVAVLLLPGLGLLLFTMTWLEDRLFREAEPARHARRRHLRLIPGGRAGTGRGPAPAAVRSSDPSAGRSPAPAGRRPSSAGRHAA